MAQRPAVKLIPATIEDLDSMLEIGERAFTPDQMAAVTRRQVPKATLQAFRRARLEKVLKEIEGGNNNNAHYLKLVLDEPGKRDGEQKIVACGGWHAPSSKDELRDSFKDAEEVISSSFSGKMVKLCDEKSNELLGPDPNSRYWYLATLYTDPDYQGQGYGSQIVRWGLENAKADAQARPGKIEGVYLIATPAGLKTYLKAGMTVIGEGSAEYVGESGEKGEYKLVWLVQKF